jgi:putative methionine-R-sulfoxide reductase with GAF domain
MDKPGNSPKNKQQRYALWVGLLISLLLVLPSTVIIFIAVTTYTLTPQTQTQIAVMGAVSLLIILSTILIWQGRVQLGVQMLILSPLPLYPTSTFVFTGVGSAMGIVAPLQTAFIASYFLPQWKSRLYILLGIAVGIATVTIDVFWEGTRITPPGDIQQIVSVFLIITIVVATVLVARQFSSYALRSKLLMVFLVLGLAAVTAISYLNNRTLEAALMRVATQNVNQFAQAQSDLVGDLLVRQVDAMQTLARGTAVIETVTAANRQYPPNQTVVNAQIAALNEQWPTLPFTDPLVQDVLTNAAAAQLLAFSINFRDHASLLITDQYGAIAAASSRPGQYNQAQEDWWQASYNNGAGAVVITQPIFDERTSGNNIIIALPLYEAGGQTAVGVLATVYRIRGLGEPLTARAAEQTIQTELYLGESLRLTPGVSQPGAPGISAANWALLLETDEPALTMTYDAVPSLVSLMPVRSSRGEQYIANLGWHIAAQQQLSETLALLNEQERNSFIIAGVIAISSTIIALVMTQIIINPIYRLTESANRIAAGELDVTTAVDSEDEIGQLAASFNSMTDQLRQTLGGLENRTRALTNSAEISRRLSTILDPQTLVAEVVNQIQSTFNYYHVHIYLLDERRKKLIMSGGTGDAGAAMLAGGHQLATNQGLVGQAATKNKIILAANVRQTPNWLPNPLLPETRSEIAVPIAVAGRPLGVLDVQHNVTDGLGEEDAILLQTIADQLAIALQNARLYAATEQQANRESMVNAIGQQIQNATTIEAALKIAAEELGKATGAPQTRAQIYLQQAPRQTAPRQLDRQPTANGELDRQPTANGEREA